MTDRIEAIRTRVINSRQLGDPKAQGIHEESFAESEGDSPLVRAGKASAHYYRNQDLTIRDGELIVGVAPGSTFDTEARVVPAVFGRANFSWAWSDSDEVQRFFAEGMFAPAGNHTTLDYQAIFAHGFQGLLERIDERMGRLDPDDPEIDEKCDFLMGTRLLGEGFIDCSSRYADHAAQLADQETCPERQAELAAIASACRRVPAKPPTNFWEACQCAWFSFFFLPDAPGRVDQYLAPWYERDIASGAITREFAKELIACLWLKYFESVGAASGVSAHNHLTLGGVKPDGTDGCSEVTALCLEVTEELSILRPQVGFRWHASTPRPMLRKAVEALRSRSGNPDFCSDEQIVPALAAIGVAVEDARDFSLSGCHEVIVTGKAQMGSVEGFINMPKILRMALGLEPALQPDADLAGIDSYETLWSRLTESMNIVADIAHEASVDRDRTFADQMNLQASLVTQDCIENVKGYTQGGARYNFCNWDVIGLANLADSLAAIRALVFDEQAVSLPDLIEVLDGNWEENEPLRQRVLNEVPNYGNEDNGADAAAVRVIETFSEVLKKNTPYRGGEYILGTTAGGENMHIEFGRLTGATPDGRRSGEPVADSIGPAQGRDRGGVTAMLNSVAGLPHRLLPTATTLNVKLDPRLLDTDEGLDHIAALIE
ncbi:MAG TPA: pyruvate formate lyase family protein, partial [Armatimonadota bacterium]|nr:pyruvate formate lyase family protein [Armatimonadota bacterium]